MSACWYKYVDTLPVSVYRAFGFIFMLSSPIITAVNALLIISFIATKQPMKKTSNFLILCLSMSDCLIGAVAVPALGIENLWKGIRSTCTLITINMTLQSCLGGISLGMTILLAIDRYLHMNPDFHTSPSKFARIFRAPYIYIVAFTTCLLALSISIAAYLASRLGPNAISQTYAALTFFLVLLEISFAAVYIRGYLRIRRYVAENPIYANRQAPNADEGPGYMNELFKTVLLLLIAMLATWSPFLALHLAQAIWYFKKNAYLTSNAFIVFRKTALWLFYSSSAINALIIFYRNKKSREWLFEKFSFRCKQRSEEQQAPV